MALTRSHYGRGSGPVYLDNINCVGSEDAVINCTRQSFGTVNANCRTHHEDASVNCSTGKV